MYIDNRGQIRVLESLFAVAVVFSALLLIRPIYISFSNQDSQNTLYSIGMNVLIQLSKDGELGRLIRQRNWTEISSRLSIMLPLGVSYNFSVYDEDLAVINGSEFSNGDLNGRNVISIQYILVDRTQFTFYIVRLQLAWKR